MAVAGLFEEYLVGSEFFHAVAACMGRVTRCHASGDRTKDQNTGDARIRNEERYVARDSGVLGLLARWVTRRGSQRRCQIDENIDVTPDRRVNRRGCKIADVYTRDVLRAPRSVVARERGDVIARSKQACGQLLSDKSRGAGN